MAPLAGAYLFLLGLASGAALLTASAFRRVSPPWLKGLLAASALFVVSRYVTLALFATAQSPERVWGWRYCWFATSLALPLQSAFAVDQLVRHPAMSSKRLLRWLAPFLLVYGAVILFADVEAMPDRVVGWSLRLSPAWRVVLAAAHGLFVAGFLTVCVLLFRKIPLRPIRIALLGLALGQALLALDGLLLARGAWYFRPYLFTEMLMLAALWHAYETGAALQGG
ncbi:MAG: hypothetical protein HYT90_04650 [Candidatus Omnitrophica bacterium]|nr:hypothetical protein [Candidatus Omnitrophota bacterium]